MQIRESLERFGGGMLGRARYSRHLEALLLARSLADLTFPLDPAVLLPEDADVWALLHGVGLSRREAAPGQKARLVFASLDDGQALPAELLSRAEPGAVVLVETWRKPSILDLGPDGTRVLAEIRHALPAGAMPEESLVAAMPHLGSEAPAPLRAPAIPGGLRLLHSIPFGGMATTLVAPLVRREAFADSESYLDTIASLLATDAVLRERGAWPATGLLQIAIREGGGA